MISSSISRSGWFYFYNLEKRQPSKTHHQERQKSTTCTDQERFRLSYRLSTIKKPAQRAHKSQFTSKIRDDESVTSPGKTIYYASMLTDLKSSLNHALSPHHPVKNGPVPPPNKLLVFELSTKSLVFQSPSVKRTPGDTNTESSFFN